MIRSNNEAGRSMIEMLGVLAIIGVLSVGGIAGYSKAMTQYKINKTADQVTQIVGNVRTLFASRPDYTVFSNEYMQTGARQVIQKAHLAPEEMWNSDRTKLEHPFGGEVTINYAYDRKGNYTKAFGIQLRDLPEEACMALATYDWGSGSSSGLLAIGVNNGSPIMLHDSYSTGSIGTNAAVAVPNGTNVSVPMPVNVAANACQEGDSNLVVINFQ